MRNQLAILILTVFISLLSYGQDADLTNRIIKNDLYHVTYSEIHQQPLNIKYKYPNPKRIKRATLAPMPYYQVSLRGAISYPDVEVITVTQEFKTPLGVITSDNNDYKNNIYDKGHLVPKKPFNDIKENQNYLWSYLNCALMHETLNRGVWRVLEDYERTLNRDSLFDVHVEIVVNFSNTSNKVDGGATIPSSFTKIITYSDSGFHYPKKHTTEAYTFPNNSSVKGKKKEDFFDSNLSGQFVNH